MAIKLTSRCAPHGLQEIRKFCVFYKVQVLNFNANIYIVQRHRIETPQDYMLFTLVNSKYNHMPNSHTGYFSVWCARSANLFSLMAFGRMAEGHPRYIPLAECSIEFV